MTEKEFASIQKTALTTIPLNKIDSNGLPCEMASGFFLKYKGNMFFITAQHIYENDFKEENGKWGIVCSWDLVTGTLIKPLNQMKFHIVAHFSQKMSKALTSPKMINIIRANGGCDIDFAYKLMDFVKTEIKISEDGQNILFQSERFPIEDNLETDVNPNETYIFSGYVKPYEQPDKLSVINGIDRFGYNVFPVCFHDLKYLKKKDTRTGEMFVFEMPEPIDAEYIRGCSGAPIFDSNGNLVALVSERHTVRANRYKKIKEKTLIYGLNLKRYKTLLDIELDQ